ncbi:hypothetical protein F4677DRAFT_119998 [Hypoxylon crocopeplum]|nr:hypothetical protein F4677DRAFT_119998 [Hypoxylon crocopeplum]
MPRQGMPTSPPTRQRSLPVPPNRRRDKPQLSCNLCRRRKVKCDRQQPCRTCSLRGLAMSCTYPPEGTSRPADRDPHTVQNRIRELESLVHALMQRAASKNPSNVTSTPQSIQASTDGPVHRATEGSPDLNVPGGSSGSEAPSDCGTLTSSAAGVSYFDGAHWTALLDGISELKDCFQDATEQGSSIQVSPQAFSDNGPSPLLLYGRFAQASKAEILGVIPPRPAVDCLVSQFFNSIDLAPSLIHSGQFIRMYDKFWEDPFAAPITWIGLLFAMMCLASLLALPHASHYPGTFSPDPEGAGAVRMYREKIVQCLILGKYTKGGPYIVQTLILYIAIEHLLKEDSEFGTHILLGMIMNVAMRMGYHRDPKYFSVISPFDGEMRRRTWATIYQANLIFASQMGLPSMLKEYQIDTEEPHNLLDSDFDEDTTTLPPSRPETETTPVLYIITRSRVAHLWEEVRDIATDCRRHRYEEVLAMDRRIQASLHRIPPSLKMQPIAQSITDPPHLIMQRVWLEICLLRLQAVLHKNYFMAHAHYERYSYSRSVSLKSGLKILEYQHLVCDLVRPDGLLYGARWKLTSVMNNEFLLATTIVCAYLKQISENPQSAVEGVTLQNITQLLTKSSECWQRFSPTSQNARRATKIIQLVLKITATPTESPAGVEDELSPMLAFQDPLLLDLSFPCTLDDFYSGDDSTTMSDPSLESTPFTQHQPIDDEWINMFQRVSTRVQV